MTKLLEINTCWDCNLRKATFADYWWKHRCSAVDKALDLHTDCAIPDWCPLPDVENKEKSNEPRDE